MWDERTRARNGEPELQSPGAPAVLATDELAALVAGIVQVTLDTRLADCTPARRAALAHELQLRLGSLFGAPAPAADPVLAPRTEEAPARQREVEAPPPAGSVPAHPLANLLDERLSRLGSVLGARADLRARLIALALASQPQALEVGEDVPEVELRSLDLLQRRRAKLQRALEEARAALAYVSGLERVDEGLASIYRAVQGLGGDDPLRERKRGALAAVFEANLELQKPAGQSENSSPK